METGLYNSPVSVFFIMNYVCEFEIWYNENLWNRRFYFR